jgi:mono/diheme cytochrome c family protein
VLELASLARSDRGGSAPRAISRRRSPLHALWRATVALAAAVGLLSRAGARETEEALRFERDGVLVREIALGELRRTCRVERVTVERDPYYDGRRKTYLACRLAEVLQLGFGAPPAALAGSNLFLRARDGYVRPAAGELLGEPGGYLAFADAERARGDDPGWEPIGRRQADPSPFYLVWTRPEQADPHRYPWPYQLVAIEIAPFEARYPHTAPAGEPAGAAAWRGFAIFRRECTACHAINGEGGAVGPELNLPRSIVEYRPAEQIKAFVRDPQSFRYTSMPANPHLSDGDLDALVAYFRAMSRRKHDPRAAGGR